MEDLIKQYAEWLKDKSHLKVLEDNWVEITTPFINHDNDFIQLYLKENPDETITISDNGDTINSLVLNGFLFNTDSRVKERDTILKGFGIDLNNDIITKSVNKKDFPQKKHDIIQAILAIDDLHILTRSRVKQFFKEDVYQFLIDNDIRPIRDSFLQGKSGYRHKFDFVIPSSKIKPERYLQAVLKPNRQSIVPLLFSFQDTQKERSGQSIVILNDIELYPSSQVLNALSEYDIPSFKWSEKGSSLEFLQN